MEQVQKLVQHQQKLDQKLEQQLELKEQQNLEKHQKLEQQKLVRGSAQGEVSTTAKLLQTPKDQNQLQSSTSQLQVLHLPTPQFQPLQTFPFQPLQPLSPSAQFLQPNPFSYWPHPNLVYTPAYHALPSAVLPVAPVAPTAPATPGTTTTTTTERAPRKKNREPTTAKPDKLQAEPSKLQLETEAAVKTQSEVESTVGGGDLLSDQGLLAAVRKINPRYVIEEVVRVPGRHVFSTVSSEPVPAAKVVQTPKTPTKAAVAAAAPIPAKVQAKPATAAKLKKAKKSKTKASSSSNRSNVKVEATGRTATKGAIPQIPFGTYFLPYFTRGVAVGRPPAALILEPHSKAVVGNGGTAISTPISRAVLKRGVPTNVYFNPESVAIAGVGGKAHAQADLELDLLNRRR